MHHNSAPSAGREEQLLPSSVQAPLKRRWWLATPGKAHRSGKPVLHREEACPARALLQETLSSPLSLLCPIQHHPEHVYMLCQA